MLGKNKAKASITKQDFKKFHLKEQLNESFFSQVLWSLWHFKNRFFKLILTCICNMCPLVTEFLKKQLICKKSYLKKLTFSYYSKIQIMSKNVISITNLKTTHIIICSSSSSLVLKLFLSICSMQVVMGKLRLIVKKTWLIKHS